MTPVSCLLFGLMIAASQEVRYDCDVLPGEARPPWSYRADIPNCSVTLEDGALHVVDDGTAKGHLQYISMAWGARPDQRQIVEARVKVARCSGPAGVLILAANGEREAGLTLYPDRVSLHNQKADGPVRLDDGFHIVRMEMLGQDLRVLVDGQTVLDLTGEWTWPAHAGRRILGFGSCTSADTGEAWWDWIRYEVEMEDVRVYEDAEHIVVYREPDVYACFPSCYLMPDGTLHTSFGTRVRRSHIDGTGGGARRISKDGGRTWVEPEPGARYYNPAMLRADGNLAYAGAIGWRYVKDTERARLEAEGRTVRDVRPGTIAYLSGARSAIRSLDGTTVGGWTPVDVPPGGGMMVYNQSAYVNLGGGVRLVAIYGTGPGRDRSAYVLRSEDDGDSWVCLPLATGTDAVSFSETALGVNRDGHVIALMRTAESKDAREAGYLYQAVSTDQGKTWSPPANTGIWGYPADLDLLPDGRLVATYGYRRAPMGIRACFSRDGGRTWDVDHEIVLRADGFGSGGDLGYPVTNRLADGTLVTVYYFNGLDNVTHICATRWRPPAD